MKHFGVIGNPVSHSQSPLIHQYFAKQAGLALLYERYHLHPEALAESLSSFWSAGVQGLNVTLPYKQAVLSHVVQSTDRVQKSGAANTLTWHTDGWHADNTDGSGLVAAMDGNLKDQRVLILGTGGAALGILPALSEQQARIMIWGRNPAAVDTLRSKFDLALPAPPYDWIINATPTSAYQQRPAIPTDWFLGTKALDLFYTETGQTCFTAWALQSGAMLSMDGWGMLVEQAAKAFEIWHGILPSTQALRDDRALLNTLR